MSDDLKVSFEKLVGEYILVATDVFGKERKLHRVTLRGVEAGGLWLESNEFMQDMMRELKKQALEKTPVFFLPYHRIHFVISSTGTVALSESAYGVTE